MKSLGNKQAEIEKKLSCLDGIATLLGVTPEVNVKKAWIAMLEPYSAEHVTRASKRLLETYKYRSWPTFADMKEALDYTAGSTEGMIHDMALAEWAAFEKRCDDMNRIFYKPEPMHPTTEFVVRALGGIDAIRRSWGERDWLFGRDKFIGLWAQSHGKTEQLKKGALSVSASHRVEAIDSHAQISSIKALESDEM